jgi:hypothetical protein
MDVAVANEGLEKEVDGKTGKMSDAAERIEATQSNINGAVRQLSTDVELMRRTLHRSGKLWTLEQAIEDLRSLVEKAGPAKTLTIKHLGLNMSNAWDELCPMLKEFVRDRPVVLDLLILGKGAAGGVVPPDGNVAALPEDVEHWLESGDKKRAQIEQVLREIEQAVRAEGGSLTARVRSYRDLPVVHGIRIKGPFDAAYLSICRWDEKEPDPFWWGGKYYHRVQSTDSDEQKDLMKILDGYFERWWAMNAKTEFASSTA